MGITIREYTNSDREECVKAFKSNVPLYFSNQEVFDFANFLERIESGVDKIPYYVICYNQELVGCGGYAIDKNKEIFTLAWGLIHRDFHKKGFGEKLLLHRLEKIKQLYKEFTVIIDTTQHSAPFFEKYGFVTIKETEDYYAPGMHRIDMEFKNPSVA